MSTLAWIAFLASAKLITLVLVVSLHGQLTLPPLSLPPSLPSRFLINIPDEDKDDPVKLCSHIELAHWFYLDLQRPEDPSLPACSLKEFMATSIIPTRGSTGWHYLEWVVISGFGNRMWYSLLFPHASRGE